MSRSLLTALVVAVASVAQAADTPTIKLPAEVRGDPGSFVVLRAETSGKVVRWYSPDPGLSVFPSDLLADPRVLVVVGRSPGRYRLVAYTAAGDVPSEPAVCVVVIGDPPAPPVPPGPTPPGPTPPPVPPDDPLAAELRRLYQADPSAEKSKHVATLAEVYRQATKLAEDASLKTVGDLLRVVASASAALLPGDALPAIRRRLADLLNTELGTDAAAELTAQKRAAATGTFARIAKTLEGIR